MSLKVGLLLKIRLMQECANFKVGLLFQIRLSSSGNTLGHHGGLGAWERG